MPSLILKILEILEVLLSFQFLHLFLDFNNVSSVRKLIKWQCIEMTAQYFFHKNEGIGSGILISIKPFIHSFIIELGLRIMYRTLKSFFENYEK